MPHSMTVPDQTTLFVGAAYRVLALSGRAA